MDAYAQCGIRGIGRASERRFPSEERCSSRFRGITIGSGDLSDGIDGVGANEEESEGAEKDEGQQKEARRAKHGGLGATTRLS